MASAQSRPLSQTLLHAFIVLILGLEMFAFYMMLQISFKDNATFIENPWLPPNPWFPGEAASAPGMGTWHFSNYADAVGLILPYVGNTVVVAVFSAIGTLAFAIMGAYFFARYTMPFSRVLWGVFLLLMLMPTITNIVPLFNLLKDFNMLNTLLALIVVHIAGAQAFNIFILKSFIEEIPPTLFEAAEMDGAGHLMQIVHIVLPMCGSILGTLAILSIIGSWNEYLLPLIILRDDSLFTVGVGLIYLDGEYIKQWGLIMAAYTISSIPLLALFLFTMRLFIGGLSSGAIKG